MRSLILIFFHKGRRNSAQCHYTNVKAQEKFQNLAGWYSKPGFTCSELIIETQEQGAKYVQR